MPWAGPMLPMSLQGQVELLEPEDGRSPAEIARDTLQNQNKFRAQRCRHNPRRAPHHAASATCRWVRKAWQGYAIDIEEQQQGRRVNFRAFRDAQRALLDQLSVGVAQFDAEERLTFAKSPVPPVCSC